MKLHETIEAQQRKPLLTIDEQISHLKEKGVTFESCTEEEAIEYLAGRCRFFKVTAYRKLFDKRVGGEKDGQYVDLDFAQLKYLASLDRRLRDALLPMTLDVEHFAAARLLNATENNGEDGYAVMRDYMEAVPANRRKYIENELEIRSSDAYCGAIIRKYREDMPIWAFVEVVSLETFIGLYKFCADRWGGRRATCQPLFAEESEVDPQRLRAFTMHPQRPERGRAERARVACGRPSGGGMRNRETPPLQEDA